MNPAFGYGKTIILGEHFVVHGKPSLVAALPLKTEAIVEFSGLDRLIFTDNRPRVPGFVASKTAEYNQMLGKILNFLDIKQENFNVTVFGDLPVTCGGIGASAACAVSVIRAFDQCLNLNLNDDEINRAAIFAESAVHGNPSGVDGAAAVFGGIFEYSKHVAPLHISVTKPIKILLVDSGKQTNTKAVIAKVKKFLDEKPEKSVDIFNRYKNIFDRGLAALKCFDLVALGQCMNENHKLLQELGISCPELDFIVENAIEIGALGAKLTGTGGGGLSLILPSEDSDIQNKLTKFFESREFFIIKTEVRSLSKPGL
jgi:mevalonate kinase